MYRIRSSVKALIIQENKLLTIEKQIGDVIKYIIPGGGHETLTEAVIREILEELGVKVKVYFLDVGNYFLELAGVLYPKKNQGCVSLPRLF